MKKFQDKEGGAWEIELTIGAVFRVKEASEKRFDLFEPKQQVDGQELGTLLATSDGVFWEMLCHLIEPQLTAKGKTIAEFGELMAADCWPVCRRIFFEAWVDFFQSLQRPDKALPLEMEAKYQAKALDLVRAKVKDERITSLDPKVYAKMESVLNKSFGESLDSLDAILSATPGES